MRRVSLASPPNTPLYRVTLFYGPDQAEGPPARLCCVFHVKKRSWKGGIQVAVEVEEAQLDRLGRAIGFDAWLDGILIGRPEAERADYRFRARDLFVQAVCAQKLDLAIAAGLSQENCTLPPARWSAELEAAVLATPDRITAQVLAELDLPAP
jgi:hypothetical protein